MLFPKFVNFMQSGCFEHSQTQGAHVKASWSLVKGKIWYSISSSGNGKWCQLYC